MLTREELQYLYWIGRDVWSGRADVLELGPWLGGSTHALVSGMSANASRDPAARLHVVDNFRWRDYMTPRAGLELPEGASFRRDFEHNVREYEALITVHEARFPDEEGGDIEFDRPIRDRDSGLALFEPPAREIEIAFVDGPKSWPAIVHVARALAPRLTDSPLLIFQDLKDWASYWVAMCIGALLEADAAALSVEHVLPWNSVAFRATGKLPTEVFAELPPEVGSFPLERAEGLIRRAADELRAAGDPSGADVVELGIVSLRGVRGRWDDALAAFEAAERRWPVRAPREDLERTRGWLARQTGRSPRRSWRTRVASAETRGRRIAGRARRGLRGRTGAPSA
jgi:hypothetical protein